MSAAVIYARISKDEAGEGLGVDRQERLCRKLAKDRGFDVGDVIVDNDTSAFTTKHLRPGFERLMEMLRDGEASAVLVYHADRLYRRTTDLERLVIAVESSGAQVHTVAAGDVDLSTASGRMVARMLGAAAQHESERMSERLRSKHDELARRGRPPGGRPPYGYSWGQEIGPDGALRRTYVANPAEVDALRFMVGRVRDGASLLGIARELDKRGVKTREGRPWHSASVRASLVNPAVAALRVHRREIAGPGDWPAVLDRNDWDAVQATLKDPARARRRPASKYLLSGLVVTPDGDRMNGHLDRYKRRTYATRYEAARSVTIGADDLEAVVIEAALQVLDDAVLPAVRPDTGGEVNVAGLEQDLADLAALRGEGTISLAEWLAAREPLQARLAAARRTVPPSSKAARLLAQPGAVREAWPDLDDLARRAVLDAVIERITVGPTTRGRWATVEDRLDDEHGWGISWTT